MWEFADHVVGNFDGNHLISHPNLIIYILSLFLFGSRPGVHDGMAQYFRCGDCDHMTVRSVVDSFMCNIS